MMEGQIDLVVNKLQEKQQGKNKNVNDVQERKEKL